MAAAAAAKDFSTDAAMATVLTELEFFSVLTD